MWNAPLRAARRSCHRPPSEWLLVVPVSSSRDTLQRRAVSTSPQDAATVAWLGRDESCELTKALLHRGGGLLCASRQLWRIPKQTFFPFFNICIYSCLSVWCTVCVFFYVAHEVVVIVSISFEHHVSDYFNVNVHLNRNVSHLKKQSYLISENVILFVCVQNLISAKHLIKMFISLWLCSPLGFLLSFPLQLD